MHTILLTGFEPFGGSDRNPSAEVVYALAEAEPTTYQLVTAILPVDTLRAPAVLQATLAVVYPDVVLCLGEARGRTRMSVERVALNLLDFNEPDNAGHARRDLPIMPDGPAAYFATLPVRTLAEAIAAAGTPVELSLSAGTYLCNQVFYTLLHHAATHRLKIQGGFIHMPSLPEQVVTQAANKPVPSLALATSLAGIQAALTHLATAPTV